jgi:hypothetical protein
MALLEFGIPRKALVNQAVWFGSWVAVTLIGAFLRPDKSGHGTHQQLGLPPCPSVLLFDRPCPGCGLTTSWTSLIHGHFTEAFHAHPLGPPMYLLYAVTAIVGMYGYIVGARLNTDARWFSRATTVAVTIFIGFGLIRMAVTPHFATPSERFIAIFGR